MNAAAAAASDRRTEESEGPEMNGPLTFSVIFHAVIIMLSLVGLPFIVRDYPLIDNSVAVEIVEIDKIAQTDRAPNKAEQKDDKPKHQPRDVPPELKKPLPPSVTAPTPEKPVPPEKPTVTDELAPPEKAKPPEKKEEAKPAPPKPKARPTLPKTEEKVEEQQDFNALLKNLMKEEPKSDAENTEGTGSQPAPQATLGDRVTMTELDALRMQLSQCWKLQAGMRYAETMIVEIKLTINPDRTVREAHIVDQIRYSQDSFFRAAADSAYRAVFSPECTPLMLPPEKYNQWNSMIFRFNPADML